jgi:hypothetical protein
VRRPAPSPTRGTAGGLPLATSRCRLGYAITASGIVHDVTDPRAPQMLARTPVWVESLVRRPRGRVGTLLVWQDADARLHRQAYPAVLPRPSKWVDTGAGWRGPVYRARAGAADAHTWPPTASIVERAVGPPAGLDR